MLRLAMSIGLMIFRRFYRLQNLPQEYVQAVLRALEKE